MKDLDNFGELLFAHKSIENVIYRFVKREFGENVIFIAWRPFFDQSDLEEYERKRKEDMLSNIPVPEMPSCKSPIKSKEDHALRNTLLVVSGVLFPLSIFAAGAATVAVYCSIKHRHGGLYKAIN